MKAKLLYIILISAAGIAISANVAFGFGPLTNTLVSTSNTLWGQSAQYMVKFTTASTSGTITSVDVLFPAGFTLTKTNGAIASSNIGPGTVSVNGQTVTFTPTNPPTITSQTTIAILIGKIGNTGPVGANTLSYTVHYSNPSGTDTGTAPFNLFNNLGGLTYDTADNDIHLAGNIVSTSGVAGLKITSNSGGPICIGTGC